MNGRKRGRTVLFIALLLAGVVAIELMREAGTSGMLRSVVQIVSILAATAVVMKK